MLKKTITYVDYNGVKREEDFYFNLTKAELTEMQLSAVGGLNEQLNRIIQAQDQPSLIKVFKEVILKAYGVKSDDGRQFIKNDKVRDEFAQTEAYSELFMELAFDADKAAKFIKGILPAEYAEKAALPASFK